MELGASGSGVLSDPFSFVLSDALLPRPDPGLVGRGAENGCHTWSDLISDLIKAPAPFPDVLLLDRWEQGDRARQSWLAG